MGTTAGFSRKTWMVLTLGVALALIIEMLVVSGVGGAFAATVISDVGGVLIVGAAAAITITTALRFGKGEPLRRQWLAIGIGIGCYTLGDLIWTYIEVIQRAEPPFPGPPDIAYAALYIFLGYGIVSAALAYRKLVDVRMPLVASALIAAACGAVLYLALLKDILGDATVGVLEKVLDVYYPAADVVLLLFPALFIVLVVSQLGKGRLAMPWRFVMAGTAFLAVADTVYQWLEWQGAYAAGHPVDLGWMIGYVLIAVGASAMRDLVVPAVKPV